MAMENMRGVDDTTARKAIDQFRNKSAGTDLASTAGVAYPLTDIQNYFNEILPKIQERHLQKMGGTLPVGQEWGISFVWKYGDAANGRTGLGIYLVPVLMDAAGSVLDYFSSDVYHHPAGTDGEYNVYNEGNLWP